MNDIDRLINSIIPEYENSSYEENELFTIAKAAIIEDITEQRKNNPNYNIFTDHNPSWLIRTAIAKYIAINDLAIDKYPDDAMDIKNFMEHKASAIIYSDRVQPLFDAEKLQRINSLYNELEAYYENNQHDIYRELGGNIRILARIHARNYPTHSEKDYYDAGMNALYELSKKYSGIDIMRHKPETYINQCMGALANEVNVTTS